MILQNILIQQYQRVQLNKKKFNVKIMIYFFLKTIVYINLFH